MNQYPLERTLVGFELEGTATPPDGAPVLFDGKPVGLGHQRSFLLDERKK